MTDELNEFFENEKPAENVEIVAEPEADSQPVVEPDPPEAEEVKGEEVEDSPPEPKESMVPVAALQAVRKESQAAKEQLLEAQKRLEELNSQKTDFYEDPEKAFQHQTEAVQQALIDTKVNMSIELARTVKQDFDDVVFDGTWEKLKAETPALAEQAVNANNPGLFAYEQCQKYKMLQEIGDPKTYKERLEAEIRKQIEDEAKKAQSRTNLPESLANIPSATTKDPGWTGPESLGEIVG